MRTFMKKDRIHDYEEEAHDPQEGNTTIVGRGATFEGNAHIQGEMLIEGTLHGDVVCSDTLTVGRDGSVIANPRARDMVIAGTVTGDIDVENQVTVRSTARLQGKLKATALVVEKGAALRADCDIGEDCLSFSLSDREASVAASGHVAA